MFRSALIYVLYLRSFVGAGGENSVRSIADRTVDFHGMRPCCWGQSEILLADWLVSPTPRSPLTWRVAFMPDNDLTAQRL